MEHFIITIARGYGSGGRTIGKMIAQELDVHCYDMELVRMASDESGISEILFARSDEKLKSPMIFKPVRRGAYTGDVLPPTDEDFISEQNLFNYQAKVIRDLASSESCIIIGRCADYILRDMPNLLRIYVHAPFDYCVQKTMEVHNQFDEEEAARFIRKMDKRRGDYYRYFTGRNWKDADYYDLCLNSSILGWDKCVNLVKAYLQIKMS